MTLIPKGSTAIFISFFIGLIFLVVPAEFPYDFFKPQVPLLILIYWILFVPHRVGVATGWLVGLFVDMLQGGILGLHALQYAIIAYLCYQMGPRLRMFPLFQQMIAVSVFVGFVQMTTGWVDYFMRLPGFAFYPWITLFTSALAWPIVVMFMNPLRSYVHDEVK